MSATTATATANANGKFSRSQIKNAFLFAQAEQLIH